MKESAIEARYLTRSIEVEGAIRGMYEMLLISTAPSQSQQTHPSEVQIFLNFKASDGGRSTMMYPFAPDSLQSRTAFSSPYAIRGL